MNKDDKTNDKSEVKSEDQEECSSVMNAEMARNYEEDEPCNDGTKARI